MIVLAILAAMSQSDGATKEATPPSATPPAVSGPATAGEKRLCKDVLGRTVRCNPN